MVTPALNNKQGPSSPGGEEQKTLLQPVLNKELPLHTQPEWQLIRLMMPKTGKFAEQQGLSYAPGKDLNWCNHFREVSVSTDQSYTHVYPMTTSRY